MVQINAIKPETTQRPAQTEENILTLNGILSHTKLMTPIIDNTNPIIASRTQSAWHLRRRCIGGFWPAKGPTWTRCGFRANIAVVVGEGVVDGVGELFSTSNSCSTASRSLYLMRKNDATKEMKASGDNAALCQYKLLQIGRASCRERVLRLV